MIFNTKITTKDNIIWFAYFFARFKIWKIKFNFHHDKFFYFFEIMLVCITFENTLWIFFLNSFILRVKRLFYMYVLWNVAAGLCMLVTDRVPGFRVLYHAVEKCLSKGNFNKDIFSSLFVTFFSMIIFQI